MGNKESRSNYHSKNYYDHERKGKVQSRYSRIGDDYNSLEQLSKLRRSEPHLTDIS